jgi:hypothetical protein
MCVVQATRRRCSARTSLAVFTWRARSRRRTRTVKTHSLTHSLYHCTTVSLHHCVSLTASLTHLLHHCVTLTGSLTHVTSVYVSLPHSLTHSRHHCICFTHSLTHSLTHSRAHSLKDIKGAIDLSEVHTVEVSPKGDLDVVSEGVRE